MTPLDGQTELLRLRGWFGPQAAPIADAVLAVEGGNGLDHRRLDGRRGVGAREEIVVAGQQRRILPLQEFHEVLFGAWLQIDDVRPEEAGPRFRRGGDRSFQLARRVGKPGQYR